MRIISQDGMIDMPYEQMVINISYKNKNQIVASGVNCEADSSIFPIAEYSTEDKAQKAMEMLRKSYSPILVIDDVSDERIKADIKPFITPLRAGNPNVEVLYNYYFQFPADNEIEV